MRILRIIATTNPTAGGPIRGLLDSSQAMLRLGHTTEILTLDDPSDPWLEDLPIKVHAIGRGLGNYRFNLNLERWIKQHGHEFDRAIIHGLWNFSSYGAWRGLKDISLPYYVFSHGMLDPWFKVNYPLKHLKKMLYWKLFESKVVNNSKGMLFTTQEERSVSTGVFSPFNAPSLVVAYGVSSPPESSAADQVKEFFSAFPSLEGKKFIIFLGRLHEKKGADLIIRAFAATKAADKGYCLVMAGPDDGQKTHLTEIAGQLGIASSTHWLGLLTGAVKWGALRAADVFSLPSHQENFGIAVAESLSVGCPALISDKVNIWREVEASGSGLIGSDNLEGTIATLDTWLKLDPNSKISFRCSAKAFFLKSFEINQVAKSLEAVLSNQV